MSAFQSKQAHQLDYILTTAQYYAILYPFLISGQANPLETGYVVTMKQIAIALVLEQSYETKI
jgi:hypothetical protein